MGTEEPLLPRPPHAVPRLTGPGLHPLPHKPFPWLCCLQEHLLQPPCPLHPTFGATLMLRATSKQREEAAWCCCGGRGKAECSRTFEERRHPDSA